MLCEGFEPIEAPDARVLVVGTLPGPESLGVRQYYANSSNSFWRIVCEILGTERESPYEKRCRILMEHGIALWDVCKSAVRDGSQDKNIIESTIVPNDFGDFFKSHPVIRQIYFNGDPPRKLFRRKVSDPPPVFSEVLPSTSNSHSGMIFEEKLEVWRAFLAPFISS